MRIAVVIPARNEQANVGSAVRSARKANADEIVVVDGSSSDATSEVARRAGALVLHSNPGRARQQNIGAAACTAEVLLFLHADGRLSQDCLNQVRQSLTTHSDRWGGAFRQRIAARGIGYRWLEAGNALRVRLHGPVFGDQALFVRRAVFQSLGGFPNEIFMEDLILSRELNRQSPPVLLAGPVWTSARRWQQNGIVRQTLRNWALQAAFLVGVPPSRLAKWYRGH